MKVSLIKPIDGARLWLQVVYEWQNFDIFVLWIMLQDWLCNQVQKKTQAPMHLGDRLGLPFL
jgi:hypothetical protein